MSRRTPLPLAPLSLSLALLLPALLLPTSGCIYRSKVAKRKFELPAGFGGKHGKRSKRGAGRWWRSFGDATLSRLVRHALRHNLDLAVAEARVEQARQQINAATAGWWPTITGQAQAQRSQSVFQFGQLGAQTFAQNTFQFSLSASYEIDIWGQVRYARQAAKHLHAAAWEDLRGAYVTIAASVADAYYLAVQQRAQLKLLERTIESRKNQVKLVRQRYTSGVARASDLYQALQSVAQAEAQREQVRGALKLAHNALAVLLGKYPGTIDPGALDALPKQLTTLGAGVPADLMLSRPDLRAAHRRLLAVDARVGVALAAHFPTISLSASLGERIDPTGLLWSIGAQLLAPLFQGGRIHAEYRRSKAALTEAIANFKRVLLLAVRDVENALVNGRAAEKRIVWLEQRVTAADGALRLSLDQYRQGLTGYLEVLTSEQQSFAARTELIAARRELVAARVSLARALGGSWMDQELRGKGDKSKARTTKRAARPTPRNGRHDG